MPETLLLVYEKVDTKKKFDKANVVKQCLLIAGYPFRERIVSSSEWPEYKANGAFLQIDGKSHPLRQVNAILRYCGRLTGLYPSDPYEGMMCDEICEAIWWFQELLEDYVEEPGEKEAFIRDIEGKVNMYEEQLFLLGDHLYICDLVLAGLIQWSQTVENPSISPNMFTHLTKARTVRDFTKNHPNIVNGEYLLANSSGNEIEHTFDQ